MPPTLTSLALAAIVLASTTSHTLADLKSDGAFGFPQKTATVLCDDADVRLSAACDGTNLFVQAVFWKDGDKELGLTADGRKIGDSSSLILDVDANGTMTPEVDCDYSVDPWPQLPGLHYSTKLDANSSTGLQADSKGRGSIQYLEDGGGAAGPGGHVRVDTYLIPLAEIGRKPADHVRLGLWASSTKPEFTVNSVGFAPTTPGKKYYPFNIPLDKLHDLDLAALAKANGGAGFDTQKVPEGRGAIAVKAAKEMPKVGTSVGEPGGPPEITAEAWKNWKGEKPPTLASLKGKVVVVEFWATWCAPCVKGIPHLNELHKKYASQGLVILSMTDQGKDAITKFVDEQGEGMSYPIGMGSNAANEYGVQGIPHAFIIGRDGKLAWGGNPNGTAFAQKVDEALKAK